MAWNLIDVLPQAELFDGWTAEQTKQQEKFHAFHDKRQRGCRCLFLSIHFAIFIKKQVSSCGRPNEHGLVTAIYAYELSVLAIGLPATPPSLHMLQLRHNDEADDHEQKPRADFAQMDQLPAGALVRVRPGAEKRGDVFCDPDEKADQKVAERDGHGKTLMGDAEVDLRAPEHDEHEHHQHPAKIPDVMMGEKIQVDRRTERSDQKRPRPVCQTDVQPSPRLAQIARHARVHESAVERDAKHFAVPFFRIAPRAHVHFVNFQAQSDQVKNRDDLQLVPRLQSAFDHEHLEGQTEQQKQVVSGQARDGDELGDRERGEDEHGKQTRHGLLVSEVEQEADKSDHDVTPSAVVASLATGRSLERPSLQLLILP